MTVITKDNLDEYMGLTTQGVTVHEDLTVTQREYGQAPHQPDETYYTCTHDGDNVSAAEPDDPGDGWTYETGRTGQYSYNGAHMHSSEYIGGGLAKDILETPGHWVAVALYPLCAGPDGQEPNEECDGPDSWGILYHPL